MQAATPDTQAIRKIDWFFYFLKLGSLGFGGGIALLGMIQRDLLVQRKWITREELIEGLAFSQLCPGPFITLVSMYLGWLRFGAAGATVVLAGMVLPSFILILIIATFYLQFGSLGSIQTVFYGVNAAIIALILNSAIQLAKLTVEREKLLIGIMFINTLIIIWNSALTLPTFLFFGLLVMLIKAPPKKPISRSANAFALPMLLQWISTGAQGVASSATLLKLFLYFTFAGTFIFGGVFSVLPFLQRGLVEEYHWLTAQQFLDSISIGMITPGPAIVTVTFMGYLVAGLVGATLATLGILLPCYLILVFLAKYYKKLTTNLSIKYFIQGAISAATGAILGATLLLGRKSIIDMPTFIIFTVSLILIIKIRRFPSIALFLLAGLAGFAIKSWPM